MNKFAHTRKTVYNSSLFHITLFMRAHRR